MFPNNLNNRDFLKSSVQDIDPIASILLIKSWEKLNKLLFMLIINHNSTSGRRRCIENGSAADSEVVSEEVNVCNRYANTHTPVARLRPTMASLQKLVGVLQSAYNCNLVFN